MVGKDYFMWASEKGKKQYITVINRALTESMAFNNFKSNPAFFSIVGISEQFHGVHCYKNILKCPEVLKNFQLFAKNDTIGNPLIKLKALNISTDTLRFVETVSKLYIAFGDLNGKSIVEFGSNYGGLCCLINTQWPLISKYHLIDLPEVQQLSLKYLAALGIDTTTTTSKLSIIIDALGNDYYFVSEYALTEFTDDDLYAYYNKYVKHCQGFLIRCNIFENERYQRFLTVLREQFDITIEDEPPVRMPNKIIVGQRKKW